MLFSVFHYVGADRAKLFREAAFADFPQDYTRVAVVEAPALGAVFQLTNHIERDWTQGSAVVTLDGPVGQVRSTSVGDVILDSDDQLHGVAGIGFTALGPQRRCWYCQKPQTDWSPKPTPAAFHKRACPSCAHATLTATDWGQ